MCFYMALNFTFVLLRSNKHLKYEKTLFNNHFGRFAKHFKVPNVRSEIAYVDEYIQILNSLSITKYQLNYKLSYNQTI